MNARIERVRVRPDSIGFILHFFDPADARAAGIVARYLEESGRRHDFGQGRSVVFHRAHIPHGQDHLHFYLKQNQLYAINRDGSAHDQSHGAEMHRWAMDAVKNAYPGFQIPPKGVIESNVLTMDPVLLVEVATARTALVPPNIIRTALNIASLQPDGA